MDTPDLSAGVDDNVPATAVVAAAPGDASKLMATPSRERVTLLQALESATTSLIWSADASGHPDYVNPPWIAYTGLSLEDVQSREGLERVNHPEDVPRVMALWQRVLDTGEPGEAEFRYRRRDGEYRWFVGRVVPIRDEQGRVARWVGTMTDIHDHKTAHDVHERDSFLLKSVRDAVIVTDLDGIVTYWNEGAANLFGWSAEEMIGRPYVSRFHDAETKAFVSASIQAIGRGEQEWDGEYEDQRKDGSRVWIDSRVRLLRDEAGRPVEVLGLSHDVSERKRVESEIAALNQRLQRSIYESSHRIKNHLQLLAATADLALMDAGEQVPAEQVRRLSVQARMLAQIQDLLSAEMKVDALSQTLSARELLQKVAVVVQAGAPGTNIVMDAAEAAIPIRAASALALAVNEMVSNSVKHGGANVDVGFRTDAGSASLRVVDDGPGFPPTSIPSQPPIQDWSSSVLCPASTFRGRSGSRTDRPAARELLSSFPWRRPPVAARAWMPRSSEARTIRGPAPAQLPHAGISHRFRRCHNTPNRGWRQRTKSPIVCAG